MMKIQTLSRALLLSQLSMPVAGHLRIIGGYEAEANEFPYAVALAAYGTFPYGIFCGGSMIARDVVLSAA